MICTPLVLGLKSNDFNKKEIDIINKIMPFGLILFSRNIVNKKQLKNYIRDIKSEINSDIHILIDQEGGPVQRLRPPDWRNYPSFKLLGDIYNSSEEDSVRLSYCSGRLISDELSDLGIDINCSPCIDVRKNYTNNFLVNRIFSNEPEVISKLGSSMINGFRVGGTIPILKHIPGHGRSLLDSHKILPEVEAKIPDLLVDDFVPFNMLNTIPMAMTAHITYSSIDNIPATFSKKVIKLIRESIKFKGLIITDDINMGALKGSLEEKVFNSLNAGCDLVLDCSSDNEGFLKFLSKIPKVDRSIIDKALYNFKISQKDEDFETIDEVINEYYSILHKYKIIL